MDLELKHNFIIKDARIRISLCAGTRAKFLVHQPLFLL